MNLNLRPSFAARTSVQMMLGIVFTFAGFGASAQIRITEYLYSGANGEFVEFTNVGNTAIDMTGWSFDDATRTPGVHSLSGFGVLQPGESGVATETTPLSAFRAAWGLCAGIKVVGGYTNDNLGRADEINLYDGAHTLIDRLTYDDQTLGGPRAQNKSAWVKAPGLGANAPTQWTLSAVGDSEGSFTSSGGDVGSPGKSTRATVPFNPCVVINGAPTITMNVASTTNFLDGGATTSPPSPFALSGVMYDPTDPARFSGIDLTVGDDMTPVNNLIVSASSNNQAVVPDSYIVLSGSGASWNVKITPLSVGYANITVSVSDGTNTSVYILAYAASAVAAIGADTTVWHTGISDASDAIALDSNYFVTGDDEQDVLNVYSRSHSGLPLVSYNYAASLNLPDPSKPEVDVEAATRSIRLNSRVYWLGSMSNGKSPFDSKPNRNRLFATDITGTGAATSFSVVGYYGNLRNSLVAWGDAHGYDFSSSAAAGVDSKTASGFAAEGMVFGPGDSTLYIGLRAPLVPTVNRTKAVIAPITNFEAWFNNGAPAGDPSFGAPIELNLGGRGIRDLIRLSNGLFIIVAGSPGESPMTGALFKWGGHPGDSAFLISSPSISGLNMEGAMQVYTNGQLSLSSLQVISDKGGDVLYNDGVAAKDLGDNNYKKFSSDIIRPLDLNSCLSSFVDTSATALNSFTWYGSVYTASGIYNHVFPNGNGPGCDSTIVLHLTIKKLTVTITSPQNDAVFNVGAPIHLVAQTADSVAGIIRVAFYVGGVKFVEDSVAPYEFSGQEVPSGVYVVTAKAFDSQGDSAVSDTVHITVAGCSGSGSISGEGYLDIPGTGLISLASSAKYPSYPDVTAILNKFEYGPNIADNYGARLRGYICAPATGNYTFYLASDDQSELWLSTDDNPANIRRIAFVPSAVGFRSWFTYASQRSATIRLVQGARYYVETVHKEGTGNDHLSVGWLLPNGSFEGPVAGTNLSPFATPVTPEPTQDFAVSMHNMEQQLQQREEPKGLTVSATPNPTPAQFSITTRSNSNDAVTMKVADIAGRIMEVRTQVPLNTTIQLGSAYPAGIYFIEVTQGDKKIRLKLLKL